MSQIMEILNKSNNWTNDHGTTMTNIEIDYRETIAALVHSMYTHLKKVIQSKMVIEDINENSENI